LIAGLSKRQCVPEKSPHVCRQRHQVAVAAPDPFEWLFFAGHGAIILEKVYSSIAIGLPELQDQAMGFTSTMAGVAISQLCIPLRGSLQAVQGRLLTVI
jgi:hypothetical protein